MRVKEHLSLIHTTNSQKLYSVSKVRHFSVFSDEPQKNGGDDLAPTPLDLMSASLSSCTAMYLRIFAEQKKIEIGEISVKIKVTKDENGIFLFERSISFEKPINEEERMFFLNKSQQTPMTKMIMHAQSVLTKIL